ncbi:MAG TPA: hypothetical protein PKV71_17555 [Calditrichia bacterium]|nr:hypothetical protein [Calditrichota bacterium]HQU74846.1 hypothetical protein [Calditrichia bacterium]HQV33696.1 hypothetical protein [Calditrichia bacterium]
MKNTRLGEENRQSFAPSAEGKFPPEPVRMACRRTWESFPSVGYAFGFGAEESLGEDSFYLISLADHPLEVVFEKALWYASVRSNRGLPGIVLEKHLNHLYEELLKNSPQKSNRNRKLLNAESYLADLRLQVIPENTRDFLTREFYREVGEDLRNKWPQAGNILVSAVADEFQGNRNSVLSCVEWLGQSRLFPGKWVNGVLHLIKRSREAAGAKKTK